MTRYEQGFLTKCAEYGVPEQAAKALLKKAGIPGYLRHYLPARLQAHIDANNAIKDFAGGSGSIGGQMLAAGDLVANGLIDQAGWTPKGKVYAAANKGLFSKAKLPFNALGSYMADVARGTGDLTTTGPWKSRQFLFPAK